MPCKYRVLDKNILASKDTGDIVEEYTYQELIDAFSEQSFSNIADILFSKGSMRDVLYDQVSKIKFNSKLNINMDAKTMALEGSPDIVGIRDGFTTQTFIDSEYFKDLAGNRITVQLDFNNYIDAIVDKQVEEGKLTAEEKPKIAEAINNKWNTIAKNAADFHRLMLLSSSNSDVEWKDRVVNTAFEGIYKKVMAVRDSSGPEANDKIMSIWRHIFRRAGKDVRTGKNTNEYLTDVNISAKLKGLNENLYGHIDFMAFTDDGEIEIFNIKTSIEPFSEWSSAKLEKYRFQMALIKQMFANHGIDPNKVHLNIIPVQLIYDKNFEFVKDIVVHGSTFNVEFNGSRYAFDRYDRVAAQFIESNVNFEQVNFDSLNTVSAQLQYIFPGKNIMAKGIVATAKEWIKTNWNNCKPESLPEGGYKLTLPTTGEEIEIKDPRVKDKNEELVQIIQEKIINEGIVSTGIRSAEFLRNDIKAAFSRGYFKIRGANAAYIESQFSKYFAEKVEINEKVQYDWELVNSPVLDAANIIAFHNKNTHQLDVFTLTGLNPETPYIIKNNRKNLLGAYLDVINPYQFMTPSNFGNIEAVRTLALLNEVLPQVGGKMVLGQLKVVNLHHMSGQKRAAVFEFENLLKLWDTVVSVTNNNTPNTAPKINNNFRELNFQCITAEDVLKQVWEDIVNKESNLSEADRKALDNGANVNDMVLANKADGAVHLDTLEAKIDKVETLVNRLRNLLEERGININDTKGLLSLSYSGNSGDAALAKLYITATQALNAYYGDTVIENEYFSAFEEYVMKPGAIGNSAMRRVVYLVQKSLDNIRGEILDTYNESALETFAKFYKDAGYSKAQNFFIGNQASNFKNMFQYDSEGHNQFLFKNPYDEAADLKPYEREFLKKILYEFYRVKCDMDNTPYIIKGPEDPKLLNAMPDKYLWVPLQKASAATRNADIIANVNRTWNRVKRMVMNPKDALEEQYGYLTEQDIEARNEAIEYLQVYNPYTRSMIDMNHRESYIIAKGENFFETNIENIFIDFLSKEIQCREFEKLLIRIKGIELALEIKGIDESETEKVNATVKAIDDFVTINVYNKSIMEKSSQAIDMWLKPFRALVSKVYIAANLMGSVRDSVQGLEKNFMTAAIKFKTKINAADVAFGYDIVLRKGSTDLKTMALLSQFNIKYAFSNFDAAKVAERLKSGRHGVLNTSNWLYWTLRGPDYLNRLVLFVAKLHHDGAFDAYSIDEKGRLKYDWKKDKRFDALVTKDKSDIKKFDSQFEQYDKLIREFNIDQGTKLQPTDPLPDAYSPRGIRAIKSCGESIYGAYDISSKNKFEHIAIGRNFLFFFTWMNGMVEDYFKRPQISQTQLTEVQETDYNGNPLFIEENGNITTTDTGKRMLKDVPDIVQGIMYTFKNIFDEWRYGGWSDFKKAAWGNSQNRMNLKRAMSDFMVAMIFTMLFKLWLTPKYKKHKEEDDGKQFFTNVLYELMYHGARNSYDVFYGPFAVIQYFGENTNPATYTMMKRFGSDLVNFVSGQKNFGSIMMGSQAFFRSMQDSYKMWARDQARQAEQMQTK